MKIQAEQEAARWRGRLRRQRQRSQEPPLRVEDHDVTRAAGGLEVGDIHVTRLAVDCDPLGVRRPGRQRCESVNRIRAEHAERELQRDQQQQCNERRDSQHSHGLPPSVMVLLWHEDCSPEQHYHLSTLVASARPRSRHVPHLVRVVSTRRRRAQGTTTAKVVAISGERMMKPATCPLWGASIRTESPL